ncbi:MAG TPA: stage III sporulation AC/AD family protein [Edaphocola sp.]|nr:stage III sporulation AC/AD family protein [Edaphocola sp.]
MNSILKIIGIGLLITFSSISCERYNPNDDRWRLPPYFLWFQFEKDGKLLNGNELTNIELYFIENGNIINSIDAKHLHDYGKPLIEVYDKESPNIEYYKNGICQFQYFESYILKDENGKNRANTFYFKFPNGDIDTLYVEVQAQRLKEIEGKKDPCYCHYPIEKILYNGKPVSTNPSFKIVNNFNRPVYIFKKD